MDRKKSKEDFKREMDETLKKLDDGVRRLFEDPESNFQNYLRVMSRFHKYSLNNTLLIAAQRPDATVVAGYTAWRDKFKRQVRKGEKGIRIISPAPYKTKIREKVRTPDGKAVLGRDGKPVEKEVEKQRMAFKLATVFDYAQTEGEPLPEIAKELKGNVEKYDDLLWAIQFSAPCPIGFEKIEGRAKGFYSLSENRIVVKEGMSQIQSLKTLIHEDCHATYHNHQKMKNSDLSATEKELQAEAVSFVVASHYGIDVGSYSFEYLASWSQDKGMEELRGQLDAIRLESREIIEKIDHELQIIQNTREQTAEKTAGKIQNAAPVKGR